MNGSQHYSEAHLARILGKTDEYAPCENTKKKTLETRLAVLTNKVIAAQEAAERKRIAKHLHELRQAICCEPTNADGDMSQEKVLRLIDARIDELRVEKAENA